MQLRSTYYPATAAPTGTETASPSHPLSTDLNPAPESMRLRAPPISIPRNPIRERKTRHKVALTRDVGRGPRDSPSARPRQRVRRALLRPQRRRRRGPRPARRSREAAARDPAWREVGPRPRHVMRAGVSVGPWLRRGRALWEEQCGVMEAGGGRDGNGCCGRVGGLLVRGGASVVRAAVMGGRCCVGGVGVGSAFGMDLCGLVMSCLPV